MSLRRSKYAGTASHGRCTALLEFMKLLEGFSQFF